MPCTSIRAAQRTLDDAICAAADWHMEALHALPDGHTWRDVDLLSLEHSARCKAAYDAYEVARAEWDAYVASEAQS
jgi:hypothetical protein